MYHYFILEGFLKDHVKSINITIICIFKYIKIEKDFFKEKKPMPTLKLCKFFGLHFILIVHFRH